MAPSSKSDSTPARRAKVAVVGAGITGLAAAAWLELDCGLSDVVVVDAADRPGGKITTQLDHGHLLEGGPQGFLDSSPDTLELARAVGLGEQLVRADEGAGDRFILRAGRLRRVPLSPVAFLTSDILEPAGRLRVLAEPFGRRPPTGDESVFDFARRRIGRRAAEVLVDAMVTGVFAGDSKQLSLPATFPRMAAMEREHGSLTRALFARMRSARRSGGSGGGPSGPAGQLTTFVRGMGQLPEALASRLGSRLLLATRVERVECDRTRFRLVGSGIDLAADRVLLAIPAAATARLAGHLAPGAVPHLEAMSTAAIAVHMASYGDLNAFGRPVRGFGFLVPACDDIGILGTLFCHSIFPGQVPQGHLLLRTMVGGARDPGGAGLSGQALDNRVSRALERALGACPAPARRWVVRWSEGIAQYTLGHLDRVATIEAALGEVGLEAAGSPYRGVSVNDCIRQARDAARRLAARLAPG